MTDTEGITCNFIYPVSMNLTFLTVSAPGYVLYRQDGIAVPDHERPGVGRTWL